MRIRTRLTYVAVMCVCACLSCTRPPESAITSMEASRLRDKTTRVGGVPHIVQRPDFCGEACLAMASTSLGLPLTQDEAFELTELDPNVGRGANTMELDHAARRLGFDTGEVMSTISSEREGDEMNQHFARMLSDLESGVPSIVCMRFAEGPAAPEHFRLVLGFDGVTDEVLFHDPAIADGAYRRMSRKVFLELWPLKYAKDRYTVIRLSLRVQATGLKTIRRGHRGPSPADLVQRVMTLRDSLGPQFTVLAESPFVVIGNEAPERVASHTLHTVRWAVRKLEQDFFATRPKEPLEVWLYGDATTYERGVRAATGESPSTPYGFFSPSHRALFMNIATGGGTLVHEIVHPYVAADLPDAPAWVNEGLGSLFEQSAERDGHIVGLVNWRLNGLQKAIGTQRMQSFQALASTTTDAFYEDLLGINYAQSRYLMLYLQEQGKLERFYRELRANIGSDPSGYATLVRVLDERDMTAFQSRWESWVSSLRR